MTRDEWVALPGEPRTRLHRSLDGRQYFESQNTVMLRGPGFSGVYNTGLPLAEFEALLFAPAPAASDDYTRAAVELAEAEAVWLHSDLADIERRHQLNRAARDAREDFLRLYRERHDAG